MLKHRHDLALLQRVSLNGAAIANGGYVNIDDIGEGDFSALLCHTNKEDCCKGVMSRAGAEWYFPNRTKIGTRGDNDGTGHMLYSSLLLV